MKTAENPQEAGSNPAEVRQFERPKEKPARAPVCDPVSFRDELTETLKRLGGARKKPLFALVAETIDDEIALEIYDWRKELEDAGKGDLDILIHSPGGSLSSCYIVARLFARYADCWEALVPELAASGATLICLGSSKIVMSPIAQLSPLDPQVISKRKEKFFSAERQSPLEAFEAVRYVQKSALTSLDSVMSFLLEHGIAPELALETSSRVAVELAAPILSKIEPYDLGAFSLDIRVATEYCRRVSDPASAAKVTQRAVRPRVLVENYPTHGFVIDLEEARALNFNVCEPAPEVEELFSELRAKLAKVDKYFGLVA